MNDSTVTRQAFKLKGRLYTLTVLQVLEAEPELFEAQLQVLIQKAPKLFEQAPIVLDCTSVKEADVDLNAICDILRQKQLFPIGVQGGTELFHERANAQGLAVLRASRTHDKRISEALDPIKEAQKKVMPSTTKFITSPVRSGQQVVSPGDLVVAASVGRGAELLAEGHIHVYGTLRGRALAGISGNTKARIFCQSFDPELVAIAGVYRLSETMEPCKSPSMVLLKDERIDIELI